jgi:hypothetical protein
LHPFGTVQPAEPAPVAAVPAPQEPPPVAAVTSPYHPLPAAPVANVGPRETRLEQAHYPVLLPPQDVPLRPPTVEEAPPTKTPPPEAVPVAASITPPEPPRPQPPPEPPLLAALRCYLSRRPDEALALLERFDKPNQEMLLALLPLAAQLAEAGLDKTDPAQLSALLGQFDSLQEPLRSRAPLVIDKLCFCHGIRKFGDYEPLAENPAMFHPGQWFEMYAELQNFTCQPHGNRYVTRVACTLTIHDLSHKSVLQHEYKVQPDESLSPRRDFYLRIPFKVPQELPPGLYTLFLRVTDVPTGRTRSRSIDFRVTTLQTRGNS